MTTHVLTIDLEDWFHCLEPDATKWSQFSRRIERVSERLLDLLDEHGARATFFVLGDVARHAPALIRTIAARGHEVGSHGTHHRPITSQTPGAFARDLRESIALLEDLAGQPIRSYRAPYFSITRRTLWALDILRAHGIERDSSIFPVHNHRYGIPDAAREPSELVPGLVEWPISVLASPLGNLPFAGGVYFRWLPFRFIQHAFACFEARDTPVVFYLHPWELDPAHPRRLVSPFLFVRHYGRLATTEPRLRWLLAHHRFASLSQCSPAIARAS